MHKLFAMIFLKFLDRIELMLHPMRKKSKRSLLIAFGQVFY